MKVTESDLGYPLRWLPETIKEINELEAKRSELQEDLRFVEMKLEKAIAKRDALTIQLKKSLTPETPEDRVFSVVK